MKAASKAGGAGGADDDDDEGASTTSRAQAKRAEREAANDEDRKAAADERDAPRECAPQLVTELEPRTPPSRRTERARLSPGARPAPPHALLLAAAGARRPRRLRSA